MGAQGSQAAIAYRKETTWNVAAVGQYQKINFSDEDMAWNLELKSSTNVRSDRQTGSVFATKADVDGGINSELIIANFNGLLPGAMWDTDWHEVVQSVGAVAFTVESGAGLGGTAVVSALCAASLSAGMFLRLSGATSALINGLHRVKSVVGTTVTFDEPMATESGITLVIKGAYVRNGVTMLSYSIERGNTDIAEYFLYTGMVPDTLEFVVEAEKAIECNLTFVGGGETQTAVTVSSPAALAETTDPVVSAGLNVASILIDGVVMAACLVKSMTLKIENKAEGKMAIGSISACNVSGKAVEIGGKIELYFNSSTYYAKYKAVASFSIALYILDALGKGLVVYVPACYFNKAKVSVTGKEDDVFMSGEFIAKVGADGFTAQISKFI